MTEARRSLPSVSSLLESADVQEMLSQTPRTAVVEAVRATIESVRSNELERPTSSAQWKEAIQSALGVITAPSLRPVINATGVILHTNLGRAPLCASAISAISDVAAGYCDLEYDLERGARGSRYSHCVTLLRELTGCEDALIVNNCAAALVLSLDALARDREVLVSRGELIEIGGSFRIPDIMRRGGCTLVEVGTTNRTHLADYERAINERTGAIVKVHRSNFVVAGFVAEVAVADLAALSEKAEVPLVHDLGSGLMISLEEFGLSGEPTVPDAVAAGASLVAISGDKLLGGPQAGILLGKRNVIEQLRSAPLARAMRVDKLTIAALMSTLALYRDRATALREIPALAMLATSPVELKRRATRLAATLGGRVAQSQSTVGGGAFPTATLDSFAVELEGAPAELERKLRSGSPPVIGRIHDGRFGLDLRSVPPAADDVLARTTAAALD